MTGAVPGLGTNGTGRLAEQLLDSALALARCVAPVLVPVQLRVRERDPPNGLPQHLWRSRLAVAAKVETGRGTDVRVPPPIENHARDVRSRVEAGPSEQPNELLADLDLVVAVARPEHVRPRRSRLRLDRRARPLEWDVERENRRAIGVKRRTIVAHDHRLPKVAREPELIAIARGGDAEIIHGPPPLEGHVHHEHRRA